MNEKSLRAELLVPPISFRSGGKHHLAFETFIRNPTDTAWSLNGVRISSPAGVLEEWNREKTQGNTLFLGPGYRRVDSQQIDPGNLAVVYYWIELGESAQLLSPFKVNVSLVDNQGREETVDLEVCPQARQPLVIQPPLRGSGWWAANTGTNFSGHRRTVLPIDGIPYVPQRFAVDWVKFDATGNLWHDAPEKNENWFCHGQEIYAVADGMVVAARDGIIENVPLSEEMAIEITFDSAPGNFVIQDLGGGQFAAYAHLLPGSLAVKTGEAVKAGQVLGKLGNSGNSTGPHLHFHIGDRPSILATQGMPYHITMFDRTGNLGNIDEDALMEALMKGEGWQSTDAPEIVHGELVGSNDVITF